MAPFSGGKVDVCAKISISNTFSLCKWMYRKFSGLSPFTDDQRLNDATYALSPVQYTYNGVGKRNKIQAVLEPRIVYLCKEFDEENC